MAVGTGGDFMFIGEQNFAVEAEIGQCSLLEDDDVVFSEAVVVGGFEDFHSRAVV